MALIIASKSESRQHILNCARIATKAIPSFVDERAITRSLIAEKAIPKDIADTLAEYKAKKISQKNLESWVLGCDQILAFNGTVFGKPKSPGELRSILTRLSGQKHSLITANVIYKDAKPVWRYVAVSQMTMHPMSTAEIENYVATEWSGAKHTAGGYYFEKSPYLFSKVKGNWFDIMGLSIEPVVWFLNSQTKNPLLQPPKLAAVLGHPISHSKSPIMHRHWLKTNAISGDYIAIDIPTQRFSETLTVLISAGITGFNITAPYKEKALFLSDYKSVAAQKMGAANTLTIDANKKISADNTDGYGFITNLKSHCKHWVPEAGPALVLGAGGASRAILLSLLEAGVPKIYLSNRTKQRALDVASDLSPRIKVISWEDKEEFLSKIVTMVNTTSLGMTGRPPLRINITKINRASLVTDLVYAPIETPLLKQARILGCSVVSGIGMLLYQGVPGFEAWFGIRPMVDEEIETVVVK